MPTLSAEALKAKITVLQKQLAAAENSKAPAVRQVKALMKKVGVTVAELAEKPAAQNSRKAAQKKSGKIPVKYRNENGNTWTGRGKTPLWIVEAEKAGESRDTFKVG